jgi:nucleoside-diphosphate-sugar epimerase
MTKKILITGCAGFIGSNLTRRCLEEGWDVIGVDDMSNGHKEFLPENFEFLRCDFASPEILDLIKSKEVDIVFHLAAVPRVSYSVEHPVETHETNVLKTLKLMDACKNNIKRFVFASSSAVYGNTSMLPTMEFCEKKPESPYGLQKLIIEDYLRLYYKHYGFESASLRFFNVFGPNQLGNSPYSTAVSSWLYAIKSGNSMRSDGDGSQTRDMCYVDNVVDACIKAANSNTMLKAAVYNVATAKSVSNNQILVYLKTKYPEAVSHDAPWRSGDVMHTLGSIAKIQIELGYEPLVDVWKGIDKTANWIDSNWDKISRLK